MAEDFEEVYARELAPVWRFVRARIPREADAEDVTSEVFARAVRDWARYDERRGSVGAWLMGVARHTVSDWWRKRGPDVAWERIESAPAAHASPDSEPETVVIAGEARKELRSQLARLTDKERDALALRFGAGLRAAEVGATLGVSETAARMLVYRAVSKLRTVMVHD